MEVKGLRGGYRGYALFVLKTKMKALLLSPVEKRAWVAGILKYT